jgi:hypothetical protein
MNKNRIFLFSLFVVLLLSSNVFAVGNPFDEPQTTNGFDLGVIMANVANQVWYIFAGLAIIMFLVAGIKFLDAQGDVRKISEARQAVIWGIVGIVVSIVAGGIIGVIKGIIG